MKLRKTDVRGFHRLSKIWYADKNKDDPSILFGIYAFTKSGRYDRCIAEMSMIWEKLGGRMTPCLQAFDDSWKILAQFDDVLKAMARVDSKNITEEQFAKLLLKLKFKDLTQYEMPLTAPKYHQTKLLN